MSEQWEGLLEGEAQALRGHLTLDRVTASRSGEEITVYFTADMLVEERPFLALQRALRRNFAPIAAILPARRCCATRSSNAAATCSPSW